MRKYIQLAIATALFLAAGSLSFAYTVGTPPTQGPQLIDGTWLNGLANGYNHSYQSGISAAGTTQATATVLTPGLALYSIDTVGASSGIALPPCLAGTSFRIYNSSGTTLTVYPAVANNPITGIQDTINSSTSTTMLTHVANTYSCFANGIWAK